MSNEIKKKQTGEDFILLLGKGMFDIWNISR